MRRSSWMMLAAAAAVLWSAPLSAQMVMQPFGAYGPQRPMMPAAYNSGYYPAEAAPTAPAAPSAADTNGGAGATCNSCGTCDSCNSCNSCGNGCGEATCGCNDGCGDSCGRCRQGLCSDWFRDLTLNGGVTAFRGPLDLDDFGTHGNFGIEDGANWGVPLVEGIGTQLGGNYVTSDPTDDDFGHRDQYFVTTAVFHRPCGDCGLQGGVALDYMHETWDGDSTDHTPINLAQIRGNVSYVNGCREFGVWWTTGVRDCNTNLNEDDEGTILIRAADIYAVYYGRRLQCGGEWKVWGGYVNQLGAIIGANFAVPLSDTFVLQSGFEYLIPRQNNDTNDDDLPAYESWTIGLNLVWHPCCRARSYYCDPYRPLFDAADNNTFFFNGPNAFFGG